MQTNEGSTSEAPNGVLFSITIPVEKHYSQKNAKTIRWRGKFSASRSPFIASTNKSKKLGDHLVSAMQIRANQLGIDKPISCPLRIMLVISVDNFYTKKGSLLNQKSGDLDNLIQGPIDALMKAGIILDDSYLTHIEAVKRFGKNSIALSLMEDAGVYNCPPDNSKNKHKSKR